MHTHIDNQFFFSPMLCNESSNIRDGPAGARHLSILQWKMGPERLFRGFDGDDISYPVM